MGIKNKRGRLTLNLPNIILKLNEFRVRKLATDLMLATYRAKKMGNQSDNSKGSIRSSIWKLCGSNWKMIFHQGTKIVGE